MFETALLRELLPMLEPDNVFYDVDANIGILQQQIRSQCVLSNPL